MKNIGYEGKKISRMMLGTVQLGLDYGISNKSGKPDLDKSFEILDSALNGGVTCLDTARAYGNSEEVIGQYLKQRKGIADKLLIVTKFKIKDNKETGNEDIEKIINSSVETSLKNLGTESIDLLLMHDAGEYASNPEKITDTFKKLIKKGYIKKAGASGYDYKQIEPLLGNPIFEAFQLPVNMLDQRLDNESIINKFRNKMIFARSVYLQGMFFKKPEELTGGLECVRGHVRKIQKTAEKLGISTAQLAMTYVNSLSYIDSLVIGAETPEQVKDNISIIDGPAFNGDLMNQLKSELKGVPESVFYPWQWKL